MSYLKVSLDGGVSSGVAWVTALVCQRCGTLVHDSKGSQATHDKLHETATEATVEEYEDGTRVTHAFPPPVMARWIKGQSVPTADLAAEFRFWGEHMTSEACLEAEIDA